MSLKTKIPLILMAVMAAYTCADFLLQRLVVFPEFLAIERVMAERDLARCKEALAREVYHLDRFCLDWAAWDDMYFFATDQNQAFVEKNLPPMTFLNYGLNMLYVINQQGKVIWGKTAKVEAGRLIDLPSFLPETVALNHPLLNHAGPGTSISGLIMTQQGPMMVASHPILSSVNWTQSNGTLIMGRLVQAEFLQILGRQTRVDLSMWPLDGRLLPAEAPGRESLQKLETTYVVSADGKSMSAYEAFPDIFGRPAILFRVITPREIYQQGLAATNLDAIGAVLAGLVTLLAGVLIIRRTVTTPLLSLARHVTGISKSDTLPVYHAAHRGDEIGLLSQELNGMILRLRQDIQERGKAELAVRDREARLQTLLHAAPDGIITVDEDRRIESVNPAAASLLGRTPDSMRDQKVEDMVSHEEAHRVVRIFEEIMQENDTYGFFHGREITLQRLDGALVPVHMKVSVVQLQDHKVCTALLRDLTEFKLLHERMLKAQHLAAIGEMGASVAHEIRNPLAGISGVVQVLLKDPRTDPKARHALEQVLSQVARVENTVRQLLDYAKQWHPRTQPLKVLPLLRAACNDSHYAQKHPGIALSITGDEHAVILADPALLTQVFANLTENAVQALADSGSIRWRVSRSQGTVCVEISDDGPGILPDARDKVFQPFFTTKTTGTGLGLAICRRILDAHTATIAVEEDASGGTHIVLRFKEHMA